ncbi:hypothetical protein ACFL2T_03310 [Elusimicrobiota bacterium]
MKLSFWTQLWTHTEVVRGDKKKILENLHSYYLKSARTFSLIHRGEDGLKFSRGSKLVSAFGLGDETWAYHTVDMKLSEQGDEIKIDWHVDLKLFGAQAGENAIIAECKRLAKSPMIIGG